MSRTQGIDFESKVKSAVRSIENSEKLSDEDKELLQKFKRDMKLGGASDSYVHKLLTNGRVIAERLDGTGLEEATKDDLKDVMEWVEDKDLAIATKQDYRKVMKRLYRWINGGEFPEKVQWVNTTRKRKDGKLPRNLLVEDDVDKMVNTAENPRDKAFIAFLWETGARISEIMGLEVGSFEDRVRGKKDIIDGKTGPRRLPLISSIPQVNNWLANHPRKDEPGAPLWCRIHGRNTGDPVSYNYLRKSLRRTAKEAGVDKPVNPHQFRHSRATYLANHLTEAQLCQYFGWVQGSDRPADYVHLSGRDLDAQYDRLHGFEDEPEPDEAEFSPQECPRCGNLNDPGGKFCQKCGLALDEKTAMEVEKKKAIGDIVMEKVGEMGAKGTLDTLIEKAVEEKVKETLSKKSPD